MEDRSAIDTIKGYYYQFDFTIRQLMELGNHTDSIVVEGIEDIDINEATSETAIQCKYYSKTVYNHSVIAKPIRLMLSHYKNVKKENHRKVNYVLNGCFKSGHEKLITPISIDFLKNKFLTYMKNDQKYFHHYSLGLNNDDLNDFLSLLHINIRAPEYNKQLSDINVLLKQHFKCTDFEAEHYFYNNALNVIKDLATESDISKRKITKSKFLKLIDNQKILFNIWFIKYKGRNKYLREMRRELFSDLNNSPFERFFVIETPTENYSRSELKHLLMLISRKYSKLSKREPNSFCPYVVLYNISSQELINIKIELQSEGFIFIDGYDFQGAQFNPNSLSREANFGNNIKLKMLSNFAQLETTIMEITKTKEIYQFYISDPLLKSNYEHM